MRNASVTLQIYYLDNDVVDPEPFVVGCCAARDQFGDVDGRVGADVGVVDATGDAEPEAGAASLQNNLIVLPVVDRLLLWRKQPS